MSHFRFDRPGLQPSRKGVFATLPFLRLGVDVPVATALSFGAHGRFGYALPPVDVRFVGVSQKEWGRPFLEIGAGASFRF